MYTYTNPSRLYQNGRFKISWEDGLALEDMNDYAVIFSKPLSVDGRDVVGERVSEGEGGVGYV